MNNVTVNGTTVEAETGAMVYDKGSGTAAYDDQTVVAGVELMDVDGALRFPSVPIVVRQFAR